MREDGNAMEDLFKTYNQIICEMDVDYHNAAVRLGLSDSEFGILYTLCVEGSGTNQSVLYKKSGIARSTVNSAIRKMEGRGWLYLVPGEGRNTRVMLTEEGEAAVAQTVGRIVEIEKHIFGTFTEEEAKILIRLNRAFEAQLKKEIEKL